MWINAVLLTIEPLGTKFIEILIKIWRFPFRKMHNLKMLFARCWPFCLSHTAHWNINKMIFYRQLLNFFFLLFERKILNVDKNFNQLCSYGSSFQLVIIIYVMAWCWTGDKPIPEPVMAQNTDKWVHYQSPLHYSEVKWALRHFSSPATNDQWIPHTKGHVMGKMFPCNFVIIECC